jgi:hypothetical protein
MIGGQRRPKAGLSIREEQDRSNTKIDMQRKRTVEFNLLHTKKPVLNWY